MAADGLITLSSSHGPKDTMDRLAAESYGEGHDGIRPYRSRRGSRGRPGCRCGRPSS